MLKKLKALNPEGLGDLDVYNPRRVMRALERCLSSGKTLDEIRREYDGLPKPYAEFSKRVLWLDREKDECERRIAHRTQEMLKGGLVGETRHLLSQGLEQNPTALSAIGYREVVRHIQGDWGEEKMMEEINSSTRRLVAKQRKWFRKRLPEGSRMVLSEANKPDLDSLAWVSGS